MINLDYYGKHPAGATTYLEFGSVNIEKSKKEVYDFRKDQQAYDWFMLGRYANDIYVYEALIQASVDKSVADLTRNYLTGIHHKYDLRFNFYKLFGMQVIAKLQGKHNASFFELGQTLFGCIEGVQFAKILAQQVAINNETLDLTKIHWCGVDISAFFNYLSTKLHPNYHVTVGETLACLPSVCDHFFSKGVTMLYAVNDVKSMVDLLNRSQSGFFDYSFSLQGNQIAYIPTGKQVTYVEYTEFANAFAKENRQMLINRNTAKIDTVLNRVYLECYYGTPQMCAEFTNIVGHFEDGIFDALKGHPDLAKGLMDANQKSQWVSIEEYMQGKIA